MNLFKAEAAFDVASAYFVFRDQSFSYDSECVRGHEVVPDPFYSMPMMYGFLVVDSRSTRIDYGHSPSRDPVGRIFSWTTERLVPQLNCCELCAIPSGLTLPFDVNPLLG